MKTRETTAVGTPGQRSAGSRLAGRGDAAVAAAVIAVAAGILMVEQPAAALALVLAAGAITLAWFRPVAVYAALLGGLALHVFVFRVAGAKLGAGSAALGYAALWKEAVIALLAAVLLARRLAGKDRFAVRFYLLDVALASVAALLVVWMALSARLDAALFGLRTYLEPLACFYLLRFLPAGRRGLRALLVLLLAAVAVMALFGIYQAWFWTFADLYRLGFQNSDGTIPNAFMTALVDREPRIRAMSTLTSPNELGVVLVAGISIAAGLLMKSRPSRRLTATLVTFMVVCGVALAYTFSRSAMVGLAAAGAYLLARRLRARGLRSSASSVARSPALAAAAGALTLLLIAGAVRIGLHQRVARTIYMEDPSAVGHLESLKAAVPFILNHPFGIGTGMAGPRALRFAGSVEIAHVESSYLQLMMEFGIAGGLFIALSLALVVWTLARSSTPGDPSERALSPGAEAAWTGALFSLAFLPLLQELQLMTFLWTAAALVLRGSAAAATSSRCHAPSFEVRS